MKWSGLCILSLSFLGIFSCGKNNESGKNATQWNYSNPYSTGYNPLTSVNSPYNYQGMSVNQVMSENPCISGFGGFQAGGNYIGQRIPIRVPMVNFPTVIPPGDIYVGVTSYGDVAVLAGQPAGQPPLFEAYMCPRSFAQSGQGQLLGVKIGAYSNCLFKPITAASVILPGGASAEFRWSDGGSSTRQKFSFCR